MIAHGNAPRHDFLSHHRCGGNRAKFGLDDLAKRGIFHRIAKEDRKIFGCRIVIHRGEAVGVGEITVGGADIVGFLCHQFGKTLDRTGDTFRQYHARVIGRR